VTDHARAGRALEECEAHYRALFEHADDAIFILSGDVFIDCNPRTLEMFRCTRDEIIGKSPFLYSPATQPDGSDSRKKALEKIQCALAGEPQFFRWVHHRLDGSPFHAEISLNRVEAVNAAYVLAIVRDVTDRVLAERALEENRSYLKAVLDSVNDAVFVDDADTFQVIDVNLRCCEMYGYSHEEMLRTSIGDLSLGEPPYSQADALEWLKRARRLGPQRFDWLAKRKDGSLFWAEVSIRFTLIGSQNRFVVVARDVTERKNAEERIRESEETYRNLFQNAQVGLFRTRISDGKVLECNDQLALMFGYGSREEFIAEYTTSGNYVDPGTRERMLELLRRDGVFRGFEARFRRKDQSIVWVRYSARIDLEHGWIEGVAEDVSERKQAEAERARLAAAIEQAAEMIVITDPEGTIQYVNPAFVRVTGYSREEVLGRNPRLLQSGLHDQAFYEDLWGTITAGRVWQGRIVNKRKDGRLYTETSTISAVVDESDRIVNFVAVKRDISEHLRSEEEKGRLEEQLRQAQKLESIGRLAGGVAHDFNNLLSVILGHGEIALSKLREGDPLTDNIRAMVSAAQRSASLTRQLLAFSRKQALQPIVLDLNELVGNLSGMLGRLLGEDISLDLFLAEDAARVLADPGQIEQVIMNLAVNARDAMPQGGRLLIETANADLDRAYCRTHPGVAPGKYVMLAVSDTGCGMEADVQRQIFEPFFTTKGKGRGTGLGLATVYGIVKQSGGNIWVYSELGEGTTFKVYLPQTEASPAAPAADVGMIRDRAGGAHILVVEDDDSLRTLIGGLLTRLGYQVTLAGNGGEALLLVEETGVRPDLVLTDVVMPNMSGRQLIDRLKRHYPDLLVLYMSGYTDNAIVHHGVLDPDVPFLQKPFSIATLAARLGEVLGTRVE
jgi:PAS domain S-box-containing protein